MAALQEMLTQARADNTEDNEAAVRGNTVINMTWPANLPAKSF